MKYDFEKMISDALMYVIVRITVYTLLLSPLCGFIYVLNLSKETVISLFGGFLPFLLLGLFILMIIGLFVILRICAGDLEINDIGKNIKLWFKKLLEKYKFEN